MHWPLPPVSIEAWMKQMAEVYEEGLIGAIGISNYDLEKTIKSVEALKKTGLTLAKVHRLSGNPRHRDKPKY